MQLLQYISDLVHEVGEARIVVAAAGAIVAYAAGLVVYRIWFHPLSKYPGPKLQAAWYLPHLYHNHVVGDGVRRVARQHVKYGPIVRIGPNHLSIDGSIGWKDIYAHHAGKEEFRKSVVPTPGADQTLIVAPKDAHRRMRRQLAHAFSDAALIEQESVVVDYLDLLISRLTERVGTEINMVSWFNFTTFDIIGDLAFSDPFDSLASNGYHPWVLSIFEGIRSASQRRLLHNYPILFRLIELLPASISPVGALAILRNNAGSKVTARMEKGEDGGKGRRDFLSYMMRKTRDGKAGMSEGEIRNSTPTVVIAGSETTATALSGLMFYLKQYPDTYDKLVNEIRTSFTSESEITMQSTAKLEYLQACLQEILRVYPPVPETPSRLSPGAEVDGEYMPKDVRLTVYQWATYRNPSHFQDADDFRPQRWLAASHPLYEAKYKDDRRDVVKPFSFGARDCIGKNLANAEMRLIASRLLFRFDYDLSPNQERWHDSQRCFVLWEKGPLYLTLKNRKA